MCTLEKRGSVYILTISGDGEHRLNPNLIDSLHAAVLRLKSFPSFPSSALITTAHGKFFSNGFDLNWAKSSSSPSSESSKLVLMASKLRSLISDLISLPMPTIAAVNGHAAAAGMVLALSHDYVLMRKERGFLYMSEMDIGLVLPRWILALFECKVGDGRVRREVLMEARKLTAEMAAGRGIVDRVCSGGVEGTVAEAVAFGEELVRRKWEGHVYAANRRVTLHQFVKEVDVDTTVEERLKILKSKL